MSVEVSTCGNCDPIDQEVIASVVRNSTFKNLSSAISVPNGTWQETKEDTIEGIVVAKENLSQVENLTHLKKLTIWNGKKPKRRRHPGAGTSLYRQKSKSTGSIPDGLGRLKELRILEFAGEKGIETDMCEVGRLTGLTVLNLKGCVGLDYTAMECLADLKNLKVLLLGETDAGDKCLEFIPNFINLQVLDLSRCFFGSLGMERLATLTSLRKLTFQHTYISYEALEALGGLLELQDLDLHGCSSIGDEEMGILGGFCQLKRLMLGHTSVGDVGIKQLTCLRELVQLELYNCKRVSDAGLTSLGWLVNLRRLDLSFTNIGNDGLEHLSGLEMLQCLDVFMCQNVSDAGMHVFDDLTNLEELTLSRTLVGDRGLQHLSRLKKLRALELIGCELVGNAGLRHLSGLQSLKMDFYNTRITRECWWV